jgi:hypothetical protein
LPLELMDELNRWAKDDFGRTGLLYLLLSKQYF